MGNLAALRSYTVPVLNKLVILGRDGVVNHYPGGPVASADAWTPLPGSLEAIARLNQAGFRVAIATNQPGLARGLFDLDALNAIHQKFHDLLDRVGGHVDAISYCPHGAEDGCQCRKPRPGMYLQLAERFAADAADITVIGAADADQQAAAAIGARTLLLRSAPTGDAAPRVSATTDAPLFDDLAHAIGALLSEI